MTEPSQHADFAPYVGRTFRFAGWHGALRLAGVEARPSAAMPGADRVPFTLIFHGPTGDILPEGLYQAEIDDGPGLALYVMPIHTVARERQDYQAVFN